MRKFFVALLILSVLGGVFAQESTWKFTGETEASTTLNFVPDDGETKGAASARLSFTVDYKDAGWDLHLPFRFRLTDSDGFDGDAYLKYAEDPLTVEFRFQNGSMFDVDWAQVDYNIADDYWVQLRVEDISFNIANTLDSVEITKLRGEYTLGDGKLGLKYVGDGLGYFRTTGINTVSGAWGNFTGVGYKHSMGDLSFGGYFDGIFAGGNVDGTGLGGARDLVDGLLDLGFGAKYSAGALAASAIFEIQPNLTAGSDDIDIGAYASGQYKLDDLKLTLGADLSILLKSDPYMNFGVQATYGSRKNDGVATWAQLTFKGTNILADTGSVFGLEVAGAYNQRFDSIAKGLLIVDDKGGSFREDTGDGLFAAGWFYVPDLDKMSSVYAAGSSGMQFGALGGYNGSLDALTFYAGLRAIGSSTVSDDLDIGLGVVAGAGYTLADIFTDWDFKANAHFGLALNTAGSTSTTLFGFKLVPQLVWKIKPTSTVTFTYTFGGDNNNTPPNPDEFKIKTNSVKVAFKWTF